MAEKEQKQKTPAPPPPPKPRQRFGLDGDQLIDKLEKRRVRIELSTGAVIVGVLVGATPYTVTLLVGDEKIPTVVNKGAIVTLQPNGANGSNGSAQ